MSDLIAYCGINCAACPLFIATCSNDSALKEKVREEWVLLYKRSLDLKELVCNGCKSETVFLLCRGCDIKKCCINKGLNNCSECSAFQCERIRKFYQWQSEQNTKVEIPILTC